MNKKVVLFDADGVLTLPEEFFVEVYVKSHGLGIKPFQDFFKNDWPAIVTGKKDLKESINENPGLWQWDGTADELLDMWFKQEDVRNTELIKVIGELKKAGHKCYMATDQERYRGEYMRNVMLPGLFEDYFISSEIGYKKTDHEFFGHVTKKFMERYPEMKAEDIIFFDDSQAKIDVARSCGLDARIYLSVDQVSKLLI